MYRPLPIKQPPNMKRISSITPFKGENLRQYSGLLDSNMALRIVNYIPDAEGKLKKRQGPKKIYEVAGSTPVEFLADYTSDIQIFAYGTTVAAYTKSTDTITTIKSNWTSGGTFCGAKYGDYFFISNGIEKIWRIESGLTATEIAASPPCTSMVVLGNRLVVAYDQTIQYSEVDDGTNPPFTSWSDSTTATDGGSVSFRNAGDVKDIATLGKIIIAFAEFGKWAFTIDQLDVGGAIKKIDTTVADRRDLGGQRSIVCDKGIYYVNKSGVWNLQSLGQENVPYSDQEFKMTRLLDSDYMEALDLDGSDIAYDDESEILYITCKRNSATNNFVIVINTVTNAIAQFGNLNFNRFFTDSAGVIWGGSSIETKVFKCFSGPDDDGTEIGTEIYMELKAGDPNTRKSLEKFGCLATMSSPTSLKFSFDTTKDDGRLVQHGQSFCMTAQNVNTEGIGYGKSPYTASYGGAGAPNTNEIEQYDTYKKPIKNFVRLFVRITSQDFGTHTINMLFFDVKEKANARRRQITQC